MMGHGDWRPPTDFEPPTDWNCTSYGNDTCPSWTCPKTELILWVDYPIGDRENENATTYTLRRDYSDIGDPLLETDSMAKVNDWIQEFYKPWV